MGPGVHTICLPHSLSTIHFPLWNKRTKEQNFKNTGQVNQFKLLNQLPLFSVFYITLLGHILSHLMPMASSVKHLRYAEIY